MNLAQVGKIPKSSGLANESEIQVSEYDTQRRVTLTAEISME